MPIQPIVQEVIDGDIDAVRARVEAKPALANFVAARSPKKYAGMSILQVAYRHARFDISNYLLERGADPNFMEDLKATPRAWPVLHHAITRVIFGSRSPRPVRDEARAITGWTPSYSAEEADAAFASLTLLVECGAAFPSADSHGNSALGRACLAARELLPKTRYTEPDWVDPTPLTPEFAQDLHRIFDFLIARGEDPHAVDEKFGKSLADFYRGEALGQFLRT